MAKKDWKRALHDALDVLGDRIRDALDAIDAAFGPQPAPVPVPVRPGTRDEGRRRR